MTENYWKNDDPRYQEKLESLGLRNICVMGLGYIGLPTAALLANRGFQVHGVDVNPHAIEMINQGKIHIVEPDLDMFVKAGVEAGRLDASLKPQKADVFFICVPTPFRSTGEDSIPTPNMDYVESAVKTIAPFVENGNIVILESTSPVGSTEKVGEILSNEGIDLDKIDVAYCPERVLPGKIMIELTENDRIVGGLEKKSTTRIADFYRLFIQGEVLETDSKCAEMSKLVENASRDNQIAFANELSMICDDLGMDVWEVRRLANRHPRVNILLPGAGVGGHCIAVDPWFIISQSPEKSRLIRTSREVNNQKSRWVVDKILATAYRWEKRKGKTPVICCMGLAFKPDIDDLRESPALSIAKQLNKEIDSLIAVEPNIRKYDGLKLMEINEGIENADILVFLVSHREFKKLGRELEKEIIDVCGVWN